MGYKVKPKKEVKAKSKTLSFGEYLNNYRRPDVEPDSAASQSMHNTLMAMAAKLKLSEANSAAEHEADAIASAVVLGQADVQQKVEDISVQAKSHSDQGVELDEQTSRDIKTELGKGQPLSQSEKDYFEPSFGADFSGVRVHNTPKAHDIAYAINARAFSVGQDIFYGQNEHRPGSTEGDKLTAHELVHTMQQSEASLVQMKKARKKKSKRTAKRTVFEKFDWKNLEHLDQLAAVVMLEANDKAFSQESRRLLFFYANIVNSEGLIGDWDFKGLGRSSGFKFRNSTTSEHGEKFQKYLKIVKTVRAKNYIPDEWVKLGDKMKPHFQSLKSLVPDLTLRLKLADFAMQIRWDIFVYLLSPINPYKGWTGQGSVDDLNEVKHKEKKWKAARAYWFWQQDKPEQPKYVVQLSEGGNFLFDETAILRLHRDGAIPEEYYGRKIE